MKRNLVLKAFAWAVVVTTFFVLTLGAVMIALVVGDWILWKTSNETLAWFLGSVVLVGFLATLGSGIGVWLWLRTPKSKEVDPIDTMDIILADLSARD